MKRVAYHRLAARELIDSALFYVVYDAQPDRICIVAVAHLSRRPGYWARRLH